MITRGAVDLSNFTAKDVNDFHNKDDVDSGQLAHHHTLGTGPTQAAPGDHEHLIGEVIMYMGATVPVGYLGLNGQMFNGLLFPKLAAIVQELHGPKSGDFYALPDYRGRSPIGVGSASPAAGGNNYTLGLKWGDERTETHTHGVTQSPHSHTIESDGDHAWTLTGPGSARYLSANPGNRTNSTSENTVSISINDFVGISGMRNVHPVYGTNFITRAL